MMLSKEKKGFVTCFEKDNFFYSMKHHLPLVTLLANPGLKISKISH